MPAEPQIKPLPLGRRTLIFRLFIVVFFVALPVIVFYATGYRFEFTRNTTNIVSTGGMYVSVPAEEADIYINEELVEDIRVFRRASYIQNLDVGVHKVHVQGEGLYTWVKDLSVQPHIVTEVQSFNMPVVPQVRVIAPWLSSTGSGVYVDRASSTLASDFDFSSTTNIVVASSTMATTTLLVNQEHEYVTSLFGTSTKEDTIVEQLVQEVNDAFTFSETGSTTGTTTTVATSTVVEQHTKLFESGGEVYVSWLGRDSDIPYYYCVDHTDASSTRAFYGGHVLDSLSGAISDMPETESEQVISRLCRDSIRIDRLGQKVNLFTFMPGSTDLVLMHLDDGLYVVEVDDRSWQNTQLIYPGTDIEVVVDSGRIYVKDKDYYLELFTKIEA